MDTPTKPRSPRSLKILSLIVGIAGLCILSLPIMSIYCLYLGMRVMGFPFIPFMLFLVGGWMTQMPYQVFRRYSGKPIPFLWFAVIIAGLVYFAILAMLASGNV